MESLFYDNVQKMADSIMTFGSEEEKRQYYEHLKELVAKPLSEEPHSTLDEKSATEFMRQHLHNNLVSNPENVQKLNTTKNRAIQAVSDLSDSWVRLRSILSKYQTTLQHRWSNKTVEKRKKLLLRAWPGMSAQHRPDFYALTNDLSGLGQGDAYLVPHVNLTDLSRPHHLLNFLQSRAMHKPDIFAWSDSRTVQTASNMKMVEIPQSFGHTIVLTRPKRYGEIISFGDKTWSIMDVSLSKSFHLGEGVVTLEIQSRILAFLVRCAEFLLHDQDLKPSSLSSTFDFLPGALISSNAVTPSKPTEWRSRMKANTEAAYQVPQQSSLRYLRGVAAAKKDEAEDEIWLLRENPSYFQDALEKRRQELRTLSRKITSNDQAPFHPKFAEDIRERACRDVVLDAYKRLVMWDIFSADLADLERRRGRLGLRVSSIKRPPKTYMDALTSLLMILRILILTPRRDLELSISFSQPLEQYYEYVNKTLDPANLVLRQKKLVSGQTPPLMILIDALLDEKKSFFMGVSNLTDEIERLIESESSQRKLITATIAKSMSEVAAIGEIQWYLDQHQPRIQMPKDLQACVDNAQKRFQVTEKIQSILRTLKLAHNTTSDPEVDYPIGKTPSKHSTEKMRVAEGRLDAFWQEVDLGFKLNCGKTLNGLMDARVSDRELLRTPPWQPAAPAPNKDVDISSRLSNLPLIHQDVASTPSLPVILRTKPKTRGPAAPPSHHTASYILKSLETSPTAQERVFKLPAKAYKTMCALFPSTRQERTPGKVLWDEFLHAFYKMDFEIWKQNGSAWYFEPIWRRAAPITFHEPHPSGEIPFSVLRFNANRLHRTYGWTSESFELA